MHRFVGRQRELRVLRETLDEVRSATGPRGRPGQCLLIRGRRRVGKSSLVEEFLQRIDAPSVFFTAAGQPAERELAEFADAVEGSTLPEEARELFTQEAPTQWNAAFRLLAEALPDDTPSVVVIDEVPYLMRRVDAFEGMLQRAWDRQLSRKPVLLLLIGSDLSMMEALNSYERPFHQRGREMVVGPLNPADLAEMLDLPPAAAFDAALVTGGLPLLCREWRPGEGLWDYLGRSLDNPVSALLVSAERSLAAEFPRQALGREVLAAIGAGERTFTNIARAAGGISHTTLTRATELLTAKGVVAGELPVSTRPSKERRYRVTDPYLRFWLAFLRPRMAEIERMRGDLTLARIREGWASWRGRAVESLVRASLARLLPDPDGELPAAPVVGGYWTRGNAVEIDIVGADRQPVAKRLLFLGSIKWLENAAFDAHDLAALHKHRAAVTDEPVPLVAVSRGGVSSEVGGLGGLAAAYGPGELLAAWRGTPAL
ncbi:ATP-binding protein [Streptomyces sp. 4N509B]|uniref:ATP-binding protein n=1 Tax=Streptomyces sp. 4N509B TaxID=3457413 RepID=UPI003FD10C43